jgi:FAD/FMN-containing dehydrogenase/Fe-S oxidoreductase
MHDFSELKAVFRGEILTDQTQRLIHATDASAYRELPLAVCRPIDKEDIRQLILYAGRKGIALIPRAAGTSLAGQVVGSGIVVDISRHLNKVLEFNAEEHWVRVEPGVILDELNLLLKRQGLFFGPETSTSNRCMIGGMVGNNSCGAHSLIYGSTRDHVVEIKAILSDGSDAVFNTLTNNEFQEKLDLPGLEGDIYRNINSILSYSTNAARIRAEYPDPALERRNTGYALDLLLESSPFTQGAESFNFCKLLSGSEGTLAFITEVKLNLVPLPPPVLGLMCAHFQTLEESFHANLVALKHKPVAIELMDSKVIERTRDNISQSRNRFFIKGEPRAILLIEFACQTREEAQERAAALEADFSARGMGYHFPLLFDADIRKVWSLRKAGLGLLSNVPGDAKPVPVIEDTAVRPEYLPDYLADFAEMLASHGKECVYYAHIATGELHLRPILNLKLAEDVELFYKIALDTAHLVKKYRGSLSGEHGDGRLRGEFIPIMIGEENYELLRDLKRCWDPHGIFNPGKITDAPSMKESLRYSPGYATPEYETILDFSSSRGIVRAIEQCNGSGDCRKPASMGGVMCPSYMASMEESATTRARANLLREMLGNPSNGNPWANGDVHEILDLCLSCKGCKSECPSNVDMAKYKAEFLQHYHDIKGLPLRSRLIAHISKLNSLGSLWPGMFNYLTNRSPLSKLVKRLLGFATEREIPALYKLTWRRWLRRNIDRLNEQSASQRRVALFVDEFTNYNDVETGIAAAELLSSLGYRLMAPPSVDSGRTYISKGLLRRARKMARRNLQLMREHLPADVPLVGIEPSCILSFRDEYLDFASSEDKAFAKELAGHSLMIEEFISNEYEAGRISPEQFSDDALEISLHGHCYQKSLAGTEAVKKMLGIPSSYRVSEIASGCCGMSGSFGYEEEHYELSMKIGELVLFPEVRKAGTEVRIAASGTSCRHQIKDGTGRRAEHPVQILRKALRH